MSEASPRSPIRSHGYDAVFVPELDKKYTCPICLAALRDSMQTTCGHRFCKECIMGVIGKRSFVKCPSDNTYFHANTELFDDNAVRREILSLDVKCHNHEEGCEWVSELRSLEEHMLLCLYVMIPCMNNCGRSVHRQDVSKHMSECSRRLINCQHCQVLVCFTDITKHQLLLCSKFPVTCTACGLTGIQRGEIYEHIDANTGNCPQTMVPCKYDVFDCKFVAKRHNMKTHYVEAGETHTNMLFSKILENTSKLTAMHSKMTDVMKDNVKLQKTVAAIEIEVDRQKKTVDSHDALLCSFEDDVLRP